MMTCAALVLFMSLPWFVFFFNDTATTEIYTLSLHDALPISGVDPRYPKAVEIEQRYVVGKRRQDEIPWTMLVGLLTHELGHSFLYHHWDWARSRRFRRAFGEVDKAYRGMDNTWVYFQRRRIAIAPRD